MAPVLRFWLAALWIVDICGHRFSAAWPASLGVAEAPVFYG